MKDEISTYSDEGQPIPIAFSVDSARINHYADVIESMALAASERFLKINNKQPSSEAIQLYKKQLTRHMTLFKDIDGARKIEIAERQLLLS